MSDVILAKSTPDNAFVSTFVKDFCEQNEAETLKIVAGMVAIVNGNEQTLENMKNQKWFERIWYTFSSKNKAAVKEMQRNRDILNKYLVQMVIKITDMIKIHSVQIAELSSAIIALDNEIREMKIDVHNIAMELNDKINSLDTYTFITTDIINHKYPTDKPLISLIDIFSQLDSRTLNDPKRIQQLKDTMMAHGFSFDKKLSIQEYTSEVLSLSEDKVGRILLFCQNFSSSNRFLAYTYNLMENYFYLSLADRREVINSGEAITKALEYANLRGGSDCIVEDMYIDLQNTVSDRFSVLLSLTAAPEIEIQKRTPHQFTCIVAGRKNSGKDNLLQSISQYENLQFQLKLDTECLKIGRYRSEDCMITLFDLQRPTLDGLRTPVYLIRDVEKIAKKVKANALIYCVNFQERRFMDVEAGFIRSIRSMIKGTDVYVVLTECHAPNSKEARELTEQIQLMTDNVRVIPVLAKDTVTGVQAYGVCELIDELAYE